MKDDKRRIFIVALFILVLIFRIYCVKIASWSLAFEASLNFVPEVSALLTSPLVLALLDTSKALWGDPAYKSFPRDQEKTAIFLPGKDRARAGFLSRLTFYCRPFRVTPSGQILSDQSHIYHRKPGTKLLKNNLRDILIF